MRACLRVCVRACGDIPAEPEEGPTRHCEVEEVRHQPHTLRSWGNAARRAAGRSTKRPS